MVKGLVALCILAAVQVCSGYQKPVPVFRQPHDVGDNPRITGGEEAALGQFPYQAGINMDYSGFCGGSLIDKHWVLTAAHCIDDFSSWRIHLGAHAMRNADTPERIEVFSKQAVLHESYDPDTINNDIGLIRIPTDNIELNKYINIIKLPPRSLKNENLAGKSVRVSGWGYTSDSNLGMSSTLQFVDLSLITLEECKKTYGDYITPTKYCCSGANGKSTCLGDSGGPMTIGTGENLVHLGVVSFGSSIGCTKGDPVGFTATPHYIDWISNKTGIHVED